MDYDQAFAKIPFYVIHPEYKPYIGEKYEEFKILIVGESHYIGQSPVTQKFDIDYFATNWWNGSCSELDAAFGGWYDTRRVVNNYLIGNRRYGHSILTNCVKSFSDVVLGHPINHINTEESQKFVYFSFMNFFQMPSLFEGMKFWNSLTINNTEENASIMWHKTVEVSSEVLDSVIDIIEPKLVIFVSKSAYYAYKGSNAKHKDDANVKGVCHPGCSYWNKKRKSDGLCGKDDFENHLKQFIGKVNRPKQNRILLDSMVLKFAKKEGYATVNYLGKYKEYDLYKPLYEDSVVATGLPVYIIVKDENPEFVMGKAGLEIQKYRVQQKNMLK